MNKTLQTLKYIFADYTAAALAWSLFYLYRKFFIEPDKFGVSPDVVFDKQYTLGILILPLCWLLAYYLTGFYKNSFRKSRINELVQTLATSAARIHFPRTTIISVSSLPSTRNHLSYPQLLSATSPFSHSSLGFVF